MLERLERLTNLCGVSGDEGAVRRYIRGEIAPLCDEVWVDAMGNLFAHKKGPGPRVAVLAHMDEVGMIAAGVTEEGLIQYRAVGIDPRVAVSKRVTVGPKAIPGVIGCKPIHKQSEEEFKRAFRHDELYVDIGARDREDALCHVEIGDSICFSTRFRPMGDLFAAKAIDDRAGCAVLMELLKRDYPADLFAVFTVQEEVGLRGASVVAEGVRPDVGLVLEGTTANDVSGSPSHKQVCQVGKGPVITFMDRRTIVRPQMFEALCKTAQDAGIPYQLKRAATGGNDAGALHKSRAGVPTGVISLACRYIHSPLSLASARDLADILRLADAFLQSAPYDEVLA